MTKSRIHDTKDHLTRLITAYINAAETHAIALHRGDDQQTRDTTYERLDAARGNCFLHLEQLARSPGHHQPTIARLTRRIGAYADAASAYAVSMERGEDTKHLEQTAAWLKTAQTAVAELTAAVLKQTAPDGHLADEILDQAAQAEHALHEGRDEPATLLANLIHTLRSLAQNANVPTETLREASDRILRGW